MAESWLFWLGTFVGLVLAVLCALAGYALVGIFLGSVVTLAARAALAPAARAEANDTVRRACDRLPLCDCGPRAGSRRA